jgi:hypothetical protein
MISFGVMFQDNGRVIAHAQRPQKLTNAGNTSFASQRYNKGYAQMLSDEQKEYTIAKCVVGRNGSHSVSRKPQDKEAKVL